MKKCVISQPRFFPGLHYLDRMMKTDVFVILDNVKFNHRHEENRTRLKSPNGMKWLTLPVHKKHKGQLIIDTYLKESFPWKENAKKTLEHFYGRAKFYREYSSEVFRIIDDFPKSLTKINVNSWIPALRLLGINCKIIYSSDLAIESKGVQLLLDICKYVNATTYISGAFGKEYIDIEHFKKFGIKVKFHEYEYPLYQQRFGEFIPFLSYLDTLFNVGLNKNLVLSGGRIKT